MTIQQGIYILRSDKNNRYYIGSTKNLEIRFQEHSVGLVKSTKFLRPLKIVFFQGYAKLSDARKIEFKLKKLKRRDYIEKIIKDGEIKMGL
jgi:putative endonuclease